MAESLRYFPHEVGSHRSWKFKALRRKYGWEGEGKFWALNGMIGEADDCKLDLSDERKRIDVADDLDFSLVKFDEYVDFLIIDCDLLNKDDPYMIWTEKVLEASEKWNNRKKAQNKYYRKKRVEKQLGKLDTVPSSDISKPDSPDPVILKGVKALMEFYGFDEENHFTQMSEIRTALVKIDRLKLLPHFRKQFSAYKKYKIESKESVHGYRSFLEPEKPEKGAWNSVNWIEKYKQWQKKETGYDPDYKIPAPKVST